MNRAKAFTLVELLVVIAIIGILIALTLPAINAARSASRATVCRNNLRQLSLGLTMYTERRKGKLPAQWRTDHFNKWENFGWAVELLPFIEQGALKDQLALDEPPFSKHNAPLIAAPISVFECPATPQSPRLFRLSNPQFQGQAAAKDYVAIHSVVGPNGSEILPGVWSALRSLKDDERITMAPPEGAAPGPDFAESDRNTFDPQSRTMRSNLVRVTDGLSNTALLIEQAGKPDLFEYRKQMFGSTLDEGAWATAESNAFRGEGPNRNNRAEPYSFHSGINVTMCDTSVHALDESISPAVLRALLSSSAGEIVSADSWQ